MTGTIEKNNAVKLNKGEAGVLYFYKGWSGNRLGGIWATKETRMYVMAISRRVSGGYECLWGEKYIP